MYRIVMVIEQDGQIIDRTVLQDNIGKQNRAVAFALMAAWYNAIKTMVREAIARNNQR